MLHCVVQVRVAVCVTVSMLQCVLQCVLQCLFSMFAMRNTFSTALAHMCNMIIHVRDMTQSHVQREVLHCVLQYVL